MNKKKIAVIVLAAGMGTRMKSDYPKVMHPVAGHPMIAHLLNTVDFLSPERVVVVIGPGMEAVTAQVAPHLTVIQHDRLGTAHAVLQARGMLADFDGTVLVLYGDTPLLTLPTLQSLLKRQQKASNPPAVVVLGFTPVDSAEYGRLVIGAEGLKAIVEYKDANPEQRKIGLCNSGVMAVDGRRIWGLLEQIGNDNVNSEFYLTDIVALARKDGLACDYVSGSEEELLGINSRAELAVAEAVIQKRLRRHAMEQGATLIAPETVFFSWDTKIGRDVLIEPNVVFGPGAEIDDHVEIRSFSHIAGAKIARGSVIGPFARLRPGAVIEQDAHIGNFVEVKNTIIAKGAKANHLSYIGDAFVGSGSNIGAGTITCNYDGYGKHRTEIGAGVFIGSNSSLVAPVKIGDGAIVGAGSVITKDVSADAIARERAPQTEKTGGANKFRETRRAMTNRSGVKSPLPPLSKGGE